MKRYERITLLMYRPRDSEKFRARPAGVGVGGGGEGSQNMSLGGGRREEIRGTCQYLGGDLCGKSAVAPHDLWYFR